MDKGERSGKELKVLLAAVAVALTVTAVTLAATSRPAATSDTLVFGGGGSDATLDPALVSDGESFASTPDLRGLVGLKPGTTDRPPARDELEDLDGRQGWTFTLRNGVKFHDGTPFNAAAVCANFNRWYNFTGALQSSDAPRTTTTRSSAASRAKDAPARAGAVQELQGGRPTTTAVVNLKRRVGAVPRRARR